MKHEEEKKQNCHQHSHHLRRSLSLQFHMPHLVGGGHDKEKPPKGCLAMRVGPEGELQQRVLVPVVYLNHPLFMELLQAAEKEYGFKQQGAIVIPCPIDHFRHVQDRIDRESGTSHSQRYCHRRGQVDVYQESGGSCSAAAAAAGDGHGHGHHHHHHHDDRRQHSHHHYLPHLAACFGA